MEERYDNIGKGYNDTRMADPYLLSRMEVLLQLKKDGHYLDVGAGTGNYTIALNQKGYSFTGIEPSETMIEKARAASKAIIWKQGHAEAIPVADASIDGVLASFTIHHWKNLSKGITEVARVLKPGGNFLILTGWPRQMEHYWLKHYFPNMIVDSQKVMPREQRVLRLLKTHNFTAIRQEPYEVKPNLLDHVLYAGKHHPEKYLDPDIRKGISSFSAFSHESEVRKGLEQLEKDIRDQTIEGIINNYQSDQGDYVFVVATKL
ncbi:MAG: class I SAM-dependent methyltransferase [Bacteroidota bacterium]